VPPAARHAVASAGNGGLFDHFAFLATDFDGTKAKLDQRKVKYRENHINRPPIDQLFFPDNNNVMVELNFPRS
jgi:hypothetical protein